MEYQITLEKMDLTVFKLFFCKNVTLIRLGFLRVFFSWEGGQFDPHFLHVSRRINLISVELYTIVEQLF